MSPIPPEKRRLLNKLLDLSEKGMPAVIQYLFELEEKIDREIPQIVDVIGRVHGDKGDKGDDGRDGDRGEQGDVGPSGKDGKNGQPGRDGKDGRDGRDGQDGMDGLDGKNGKDGAPGKTPEHEWNGSFLRFKHADGQWGDWMDLRGPAGQSGGGMGGGFSGLEKVLWSGGHREGVSEIIFGSGLTITRTSNGIQVDASASGAGLSVLAVTGTRDDSNTGFTVASTPTLVVINGQSYRSTGGAITWSYVGTDLTLSSPVGTGGDIYALG